MKINRQLRILFALTVSGLVLKAYAITVDEFIAINDANGDGVVSVIETQFGAQMDANKDGIVDRAELNTISQAVRGRRKQHHWVNPLPQGESYPGVQCNSFDSPSMQVPVGYCIYLPPGYASGDEASKSFPVVYHLHGGSPGNETKAVRGGLATIVHTAISNGEIAPAIVIFVNGGAENTYNYPQKQSMGVDILINELIPHVDATYRTVADRSGRAIQGFSQGGRGATRIMFQYPELFVSAAPGGSGYAVEKIVAENDGYERDYRMPGGDVRKFASDENAYDRARQYVARGKRPPLKILLWLGADDFNYDGNLEYMGFLYALDIPFERIIVPGVGHDPRIFAAAAVDVMKFHQRNFEIE